MKIKNAPWYTQLMFEVFHVRDEADYEMCRNIKEEWVDAALNLIHEDYRNAVLLRFRDGMTLKLTAEALGKSVSTATNWISKAEQHLRRNPCKNTLLYGPDRAGEITSEMQRQKALDTEYSRQYRAAEEREETLDAWYNGILDRFPSLEAVLPIKPTLENMPIEKLKLPWDVRDVICGQFQDVKSLYVFLQNPAAKLRGLGKGHMKTLRKIVCQAAGQFGEREYDPSVAAHFPDHAEIRPGNWSMTPIVIQYDKDRKPLEIGLYRELKTGEYRLQIMDGDNVVFETTVDADLFIKED